MTYLANWTMALIDEFSMEEIKIYKVANNCSEFIGTLEIRIPVTVKFNLM